MNIYYFQRNFTRLIFDPHIHQFINYYGCGNIIDLPLYHGCNCLNRNGTRKEIEYKLGYQCVVPTYKRYWKETKDKQKRRNFYWTRYMTRTSCKHLFKNKSNFIFNYKFKKYEHFSETPVHYDYYRLQEIKNGLTATGLEPMNHLVLKQTLNHLAKQIVHSL